MAKVLIQFDNEGNFYAFSKRRRGKGLMVLHVNEYGAVKGKVVKQPSVEPVEEETVQPEVKAPELNWENIVSHANSLYRHVGQ